MTEPTDPAVQPPPPYGATPPPYGATPPAYGAVPPAYGATPPAYGAVPPPPPYGAPPGYPSAPPAYGAPAYGGYGPPPGQRINDPAPMGMRLLARIIDLILVGVVTGIVAAVAGLHVLHKVTNADGTTTYNIDTADYFKLALVGAVITVIYEVVMLSRWGATLGKKAVGVRIAMLEDGSKPDVGAAFVRSIIPAVSAIVPFLQLIMYLSPFFDSSHRNRGWYDYAAKTIAVRTK